MGASGLTATYPAVSCGPLLWVDMFSRHPSDLDREAAGMGNTTLPGQHAWLLGPHAVKHLKHPTSPAGVCLVSASSRRGCSQLCLTMSLPGRPEPHNSYQIPMVQHRREQGGAFCRGWSDSCCPAGLQPLQPSAHSHW